MIEVFGFTTAIVVADAAAKAAAVTIPSLDRNKPANADQCEVPLVMVVKIKGDVAAVESAMEAGIAEAKKRGLYITSDLISRTEEDTEKMVRINSVGNDPLRNLNHPHDGGISEKEIKEI